MRSAIGLSLQAGNHIRNYYHVLGIRRDELDPAVIEEAALRRTCLLRRYQLAREAECSQRLNEIALALSTLLDPSRRREHDRSLAASASLRTRQRRPAVRNASLRHFKAEVAACDVILVHRGLRPAACGRHADRFG